jgi:2-methylisocitrate lyase-like PEP mutase family enzyme
MWHLDTGSRHVPFCVMSGADRATSRESDVMPPSIADLLATGEPLVLPGVYGALSARLAAEAGFRAVFLSGFAMAATRLGRPDIGLLTQTEVLDTARPRCVATPCR